ncbi:unnamed protein product [Dovyalis caffra]|uniref:Uncharacterized protein n=1 Tax=Dovyalis caffra TaxID=77055 RepID=A0AAV1RUK3_9ROSI|nr:unnamed protein product [Dovyalis caffra]
MTEFCFIEGKHNKAECEKQCPIKTPKRGLYCGPGSSLLGSAHCITLQIGLALKKPMLEKTTGEMPSIKCFAKIKKTITTKGYRGRKERKLMEGKIRAKNRLREGTVLRNRQVNNHKNYSASLFKSPYSVPPLHAETIANNE